MCTTTSYSNLRFQRAVICPWFIRNIFSIHLVRRHLIIHPTEIVCLSIWMTLICSKPQLPTAFSLPMPSGRGAKPPRDAFPPPSPPFLPEEHLWPCTLSGPLPFKAPVQNSDPAPVWPVLCISRLGRVPLYLWVSSTVFRCLDSIMLSSGIGTESFTAAFRGCLPTDVKSGVSSISVF